MEHLESDRRKTPSVVPRSDVPISSAPEDSLLEVRPFVAHALLAGSVPNNVSLSWVYAHDGQDVALRSHSSPSLLIVLKGRATLTGQKSRRGVEQGDVVTLPGCHEYGFAEVGAKGLLAIHVAFRAETDARSGEVTSLEQLLARNDARSRSALDNPFFLLLRDGKLETERRRTIMRDALRVFSDDLQTTLLTRQATCRSDEYSSVFLEHFLAELGHNKVLNVPEGRRAFKDPVLQATSSWFAHQMLVLDNVGKAAVHLVLATAGRHLHTLASAVFAADESRRYFDAHASDGDKEACIPLLEGHHPSTYQRLNRTLDETWDMFDAMTTRISKLVELEETRNVE